MNKLTEEAFIEIIEKIEDFHKNPKLDKVLSGRIVYYYEDFSERQVGNEKLIRTKVEDIESVTDSEISRTFLGDFDGSGLLQLETIRRPRKKEFKGIYKYVPNNAVVLEYWGNGEDEKIYNLKFAAVQQEDLSFKLLDRNKALLATRKQLSDEAYELDEQLLLLLTGTYFDITESYGVAYDYSATTYVFPMSLEDIKEAFKNREKDNLRKSVLPTMVTRNGTTFLRMGNNGFDLKGRHFYFVSGIQGSEYMSVSNKKNLVDDGYVYRNKDELIRSKGKDRAIIASKLRERSAT